MWSTSETERGDWDNCFICVFCSSFFSVRAYTDDETIEMRGCIGKNSD